MDPITTAILIGLGAGSAAGVQEIGKQMVKDAYEALKSTIQRKLGSDNEVSTAIEQAEQYPDEEWPRGMVAAKVKAASVLTDADILTAAEQVLEKAKEAGVPPGSMQGIATLGGDNYGVNTGVNTGTQTQTFGEWPPKKKKEDD